MKPTVTAPEPSIWEELVAIMDAGWFDNLFAIILLLVGIPIAVRINKKTANKARLRKILRSNRLLYRPDHSKAADLEIRYKGNVVSRVTSTTISVWNDGGTTFRRSDLTEIDPLRVICAGGELLQVEVEKSTREVIDVKLEQIEEREARVTFAFLDPGDGFTMQVIHSAPTFAITLTGEIVGLPRGISDYNPHATSDLFLRSTSTIVTVLLVPTFVVFLLDMYRYFSSTAFAAEKVVNGTILFLAVAFMVWSATGPFPKRRVRKGVPSIIATDERVLG